MWAVAMKNKIDITLFIFIIVVPIILLIYPAIDHYFWSKNCHYEYINYQGERHKSFDCSNKYGQYVCDDIEVVKFIEICNATEDN
jgi:hypothetical protein